MEEDLKVSSELYKEYNYASESKPTFKDNNVVSRFLFRQPPSPPTNDEDGDLVIQRKCKDFTHYVEIEHSQRTELGLVGLQIWRGALLLADWLLYNAQQIPKDSVILELGSGVGLTSIIAAQFVPVVCTDVDNKDILNIIKHNIARNKTLANHPVKVMALNFTCDHFSPELIEMLPKIHTILAADVVYDDEITQAFVKTIAKLLAQPPKRSVYIALEKRYVFTVDNFETIPPCYDYFLECLKSLDNVCREEIKTDFPQYFQYNRVKELVLWKLSSKFKL